MLRSLLTKRKESMLTLDSFEHMDQFIEVYNLLRMNLKETENPNKLIIRGVT